MLLTHLSAVAQDKGVEAPDAWRDWAEKQRASAEKDKAQYDHLRSIYERVGSYIEVRRRLFRESDIDFAETELRNQFSKISDPLAADEYSRTVQRLSEFNYDTDPEELRKLMRRWTEERPESHFAWLVRGHQAISYAWYWRGNGWANKVTEQGWKHFNEGIAEAAECFEKAYALEPNDPESAFGMMTVCKAQGRPRSEMEKYFARVMAINPSHYEAHWEKFQFLRPSWSGSWPEYKEFLDFLDAKIAVDGNPILRAARLSARDDMEDEVNGDPDKEAQQRRKREWYEVHKAYVERWPDSPIGRGYLVVSATDVKKYDDALEQYRWFGNRYPMITAWDLPRYHHNRIYRLIMAAKSLPDAERIAEFDRIIAIDPEYSGTYHYIGIVHMQLGDLELAEAALRRAIELDTNNGSSFYVLAGVLETLGRDEDALEVIQQSKDYDFQDNIESEIAKIEDRILNRVGTDFKPLATPQ